MKKFLSLRSCLMECAYVWRYQLPESWYVASVLMLTLYRMSSFFSPLIPCAQQHFFYRFQRHFQRFISHSACRVLTFLKNHSHSRIIDFKPTLLHKINGSIELNEFRLSELVGCSSHFPMNIYLNYYCYNFKKLSTSWRTIRLFIEREIHLLLSNFILVIDLFSFLWK